LVQEQVSAVAMVHFWPPVEPLVPVVPPVLLPLLQPDSAANVATRASF
jgi:hypothetical protein